MTNMAENTFDSVKVATLLGLKSWKVIVCIFYSNLFFQYTGSTVSKFRMIATATQTLSLPKKCGQNSNIFASEGIFSMQKHDVWNLCFKRPFSRWTWVSRCLLKQKMMEVVSG